MEKVPATTSGEYASLPSFGGWHLFLEAVSKLSKGDHQAGDLQEGQEHLGFALVSDDQPAEVSEPGHGPFDRPAAAVAA